MLIKNHVPNNVKDNKWIFYLENTISHKTLKINLIKNRNCNSAFLGKLELFLSSIYNSRLPVSGLKFHVSWGDSVFTGDTPNNLYLASIPENRNLTEYYNAVEINLMIALFASMLHERRIIMTCSKLSALSASVQASVSTSSIQILDIIEESDSYRI